MGFLKNLFSGSPRNASSDFYTFQVKCNRCGEIIDGRINLNNDLSQDYESGSDVYYGRKVLIGNGHCFQQIEVELKFDTARKLIEQSARGGTFVE